MYVLCTYVCVHLRMYVCKHVFIYVCTHVYMYICTYVSLYVCMYLHIYVCIYVRMYVFRYVRTYVCMHYICTCACIYIYIYIYVYICTYTYIYIYIHKQWLALTEIMNLKKERIIIIYCNVFLFSWKISNVFSTWKQSLSIESINFAAWGSLTTTPFHQRRHWTEA